MRRPPEGDGGQEPARRESTSFESLAKRYIAEKKKEWSARTSVGYGATFEIFIEAFAGKRIDAIHHKDILEFRDGILAKMPKNKGKYSALVGLSLKELAEADEKYERISVKTLNDKLVALEAFFAWCCTHEFIERNPAKGLMLTDLRRARDQREPYEKEDFEKLLEFLSKLSPEEEPHSYWIPLIGMFSGMRLGEICQLEASDMEKFEGLWCFDINERGDDKNLKTSASVRRIPIHPMLLSLGFEAYIESAKERGVKRIWPDENEPWKSDFTKAFSKWYGYHSKKRISNSARKCFHSLRHAFINTLRQKGVSTDMIADMVGHVTEGQTAGRYGKIFNPAAMLENLKKLDYGLDVPGLLGVELKREAEAPSGESSEEASS